MWLTERGQWLILPPNPTMLVWCTVTGSKAPNGWCNLCSSISTKVSDYLQPHYLLTLSALAVLCKLEYLTFDRKIGVTPLVSVKKEGFGTWVEKKQFSGTAPSCAG